MAMDVAPLHTIPSSLYNAVISRIQQIQARIDGDSRLLLNRGNELASSAVGAINRIATSLSDPVWPTEPQASPLVPPPAYTPPAVDLSGHVDVPKMAKIPDFASKLGGLKIPNITIPPVPGQVPNVVLPVAPSVTMPTAPSQPSVDLNVAIPALTIEQAALGSVGMALGLVFGVVGSVLTTRALFSGVDTGIFISVPWLSISIVIGLEFLVTVGLTAVPAKSWMERRSMSFRDGNFLRL